MRAPLGFPIGGGEPAEPGGRRPLHARRAVVDEEIAERQIGEAHDAPADAREVERDHRLGERLRDEGGRGMIGAKAWVHVLGAVLLLARFVHPFGLATKTLMTYPRIAGAAGTILVTAAAALTLLWQYFAAGA
jgi:hypothetical protein